LRETYDQLLARQSANEGLHTDRLAAIEEGIQRAEKRRRRAERYAYAADDEDEADRHNAEAKEALREIRKFEEERGQLTRVHATRKDRGDAFADLIARKNDAAARLLRMTMGERRDLLYDLGVLVRVYRRGHDPLWEVTADVERLAAHFSSVPGQDKRRRENRRPAPTDAPGAGVVNSHSPPRYQNSGKPCSSRTSGPAPAAT